MSVYGEYTLRLLNTLRFRISYMRLFAIAPHNSLRSDNAPQPQLACMKYTEASLSSVNGAYISSQQNRSKLAREHRNHFKLFVLSRRGLNQFRFPTTGKASPDSGRRPRKSPGVWWHHKDDTGMREEELMVYIYLKIYNNVENILL